MNRIIDIKFESEGAEPIDIDELKEHCSIATSDYDAILTDLITIARQKVELYTHLSLVTKTVKLTVDYYEPFKLPYSPDEITEVKVLTGQATNGTNEYETLTGDDYMIEGQQDKMFGSTYWGVHIITYTATARTEKGLLYDVKRVANWLFQNEGKSSENIPMELFSNAKQYKIMLWH